MGWILAVYLLVTFIGLTCGATTHDGKDPLNLPPARQKLWFIVRVAWPVTALVGLVVAVCAAPSVITRAARWVRSSIRVGIMHAKAEIRDAVEAAE